MARCDRRLPFVEKDLPHILHGKGRSPRCVAWCRRSALGQLSTRRHTPHWLVVRLPTGLWVLSDGSKPPAMAPAPLAVALMPRAATISCVKFETEVEARVEDGGDAMTYVVEVLAFVKRLEEEVALPDNISSMEEEIEEVVHGEEERGAFSSFSTSLWSLEVSDVGAEVTMEEGSEDGVVVG